MTNLRMAAVCLIALTTFGACGRDGAGVVSSPGVTQRSAVLFQQPPNRTFTGAFVDGWSWRGSSDSDSLVAVDPDGAETVVDLPGETLLFCQSRAVSQVDYLLFATLDVNAVSRLYRIHDATQDGLVDESTITELLSVNQAFLTSVSILAGGDGFAFDYRCGDILRLEDTNADSWPDLVSVNAFALRDTFPSLEFFRSVRAVSSDEVTAHGASDSGEPVTFVPTVHHYTDTTADGVADVESESATVEQQPLWRGLPFDGQTEASFVGTVGNTVEVWSLLGGDLDTMLGSAVFAVDGQASVTWTTGLTEGDEVAYKYAVNTSHAVLTAVGDWPQVLSVGSSTFVTVDGSAVDLPLTGLNLSSGMSLELVTEDEVVYSLTFVVSSATSATVTIPAAASDHLGEGTIEAYDSSQPAAERTLAHVVDLCEPLDE